MKLTKNQLTTIVNTIISNENERLQSIIVEKENSPEVKRLVNDALKDLNKVSDQSWSILYGDSCGKKKTFDVDAMTRNAMYQLGYDRTSRVPGGFREQIELKVQMCFIDAKDLKDLEKKVGYKFVIV